MFRQTALWRVSPLKSFVLTLATSSKESLFSSAVNRMARLMTLDAASHSGLWVGIRLTKNGLSAWSLPLASDSRFQVFERCARAKIKNFAPDFQANNSGLCRNLSHISAYVASWHV